MGSVRACSAQCSGWGSLGGRVCTLLSLMAYVPSSFSFSVSAEGVERSALGTLLSGEGSAGDAAFCSRLACIFFPPFFKGLWG